MFCELCRLPLVRVTPLSRRVGPLISFIVVLAAVTAIVVLLVRWFQGV